MKSRRTELVSAARDATHLTNQPLSFERPKGLDVSKNGQALDLKEVIVAVIAQFKAQNTTTEDTVKIVFDPIAVPKWAMMVSRLLRTTIFW